MWLALHILESGFLHCVCAWRWWPWHAVWAALPSTPAGQVSLCNISLTSGLLPCSVSALPWWSVYLGYLLWTSYTWTFGTSLCLHLWFKANLITQSQVAYKSCMQGCLLWRQPPVWLCCGRIPFGGFVSWQYHGASGTYFIGADLSWPGSQAPGWPRRDDVASGWMHCPSQHLGGQSSYTQRFVVIRHLPASEGTNVSYYWRGVDGLEINFFVSTLSLIITAGARGLCWVQKVANR